MTPTEEHHFVNVQNSPFLKKKKSWLRHKREYQLNNIFMAKIVFPKLIY